MIWILRMMLPRPSRRDGWIRGLDLAPAWKLSTSLNYQSNVGRVLTRYYHPKRSQSQSPKAISRMLRVDFADCRRELKHGNGGSRPALRSGMSGVGFWRWRGLHIAVDSSRARREALLDQPAAVEKHFFARAKKVTKEALFNSRMAGQHAPGSAPFGCVSPVGIFGRHIHVPAENAARPARRPKGLYPPAPPRLKGDPKIKSNKQRQRRPASRCDCSVAVAVVSAFAFALGYSGPRLGAASGTG